MLLSPPKITESSLLKLLKLSINMFLAKLCVLFNVASVHWQLKTTLVLCHFATIAPWFLYCKGKWKAVTVLLIENNILFPPFVEAAMLLECWIGLENPPFLISHYQLYVATLFLIFPDCVVFLLLFCFYSQQDCLNPGNHQRLCVLFSSSSAQSNNAPNPCVSPW